MIQLSFRHFIYFIISWTWINRTKEPFVSLRKVKHAPWHHHSLHGESTADLVPYGVVQIDHGKGSFPLLLLTNGWQLFDEFFSLPQTKKHGTSTDSDHWGVVYCFHIEDVGNIARVKSWKPPSRVKINWLIAAHLWSVLQTCTHGAATCENIGRPEMMQKLKTCWFREGPSVNFPMKCRIWFKTCMGCCNQIVWSWDSIASPQSFGENIGHMTIGSHGRTQRSQHCSG